MTLQTRAPAAPPRPRLWTREEYYRMGEMGWFDDQRVELIGGVIYEMSPKGAPHVLSVNRIRRWLEQVFATGYSVRKEDPLNVGALSEPEPDLAVVTGRDEDYAHQHPQTAVLVIEVADKTLRRDRSTKMRLYAGAAIPDYWIVNLKDRQLEVYRDPTPTGYTTRQVYSAADTVAPLARPAAPIAVADLLP